MKKYLILMICSAVLVLTCFTLPNITEHFAEDCATVPISTGIANESVSCKGIIEEISDNEFVACIQISEEDISKVEIGQSVDIHCSALGDKILKGELTELSNKAYQITYASMKITVVDAVVEFKETDPKLKSGYSVTADIIFSEIENATILPFEAVAQEKTGEYYIYRLEDGWAVKEYIDVEFEDEKGVVVSGEWAYDEICEAPDEFTADRVRVKK